VPSACHPQPTYLLHPLPTTPPPQVSLLRDAPLGGKPTSQISLASPHLLQCTVGPSAILAATELRLMLSQAAHATDALLAGLAADEEAAVGEGAASPSAASGSRSAAGGCWLVNETGAALSFVVADASACASAVVAQLAAASARGGGSGGVTGSSRPVPLRVRDPVAAQFGGRWVEYPDQITKPQTNGSPAAAQAGAEAAGSSSGGGGSLLYLQLAGQRGFFGPVLLRQQGTSLHTLQDTGVGTGGGLR